jgi:hypothetical protein
MDIVFGKNWFKRNQRKLLWLLNTPIIRIWFRWVMRIDCKETINEITPSSYTFGGKYIDSETIELKTDFRSHDKYSKRLYFAFKPFWYLVHFWDVTFANRISQQLNFGFDTLTVYPAAGANSPVDGMIYYENASYTTCHDAATGDAADVTDIEIIGMNSDVGATYFIRRIISCFDTSPLTSGATISAAVLSLYYNSDKATANTTQADQQIVAATPAATNNLAASDYSQLGTTVFATQAVSGISVAQYYDFTLDANGIANISKTGISKFGVRARGDIESSTPSAGNYVSWKSSDNAGTSTDPKLVVTYTASINSNFLMFMPT